MIEGLIVAACLVSYAFMVGFAHPKILRALEIRCHSCTESRSCGSDHIFNAGIVALFWPLGLPFMVGYDRGDPDRLKRKNEALQRRIAELEKEAGVNV